MFCTPETAVQRMIEALEGSYLPRKCDQHSPLNQ